MEKIRMHKSLVPDKLDLKDILETKIVSNSKYVRELENELCKAHKCKYALCFGSETAAISLLFHHLKGGDDVCISVAMPSFTWSSPKYVLEMLNITQNYMDIDSNTWVVSKETQKNYTYENYYFLTSTFGKIPEVFKPKKTIIDGAASAGFFDMEKHPCLSLLVSFSPSKTITGIEGGALMTDNKKIYDALKKKQHIMSRMGEINAKIALENLKNRNKIWKWKKFLYNTYKEALPFAQFQEYDDEHSLNEIAVVLPFKKWQWDALNAKMEVRKRYNPNIDWHTEFVRCKENIGANIYKNIVTLPSYPGCDYEEVIKLIKDISRK